MPPKTSDATVPTEDRLAVGALLDSYPFLVDDGRYRDLANLFTPDGVIEGPVGEAGVGREGIEEFFRAAAGRVTGERLPRLMRHHVTSRQIEIHGEKGSSRSYFVAFTEHGADHWGRYRDELDRVDGRWLIARRALRVDGYVAGSWWERNLEASP